jgi:energy-coupling factor transporter transmembrane protein EcfT
MLSSIMTAVPSHSSVGAAWGWVIDVALGVLFALIYAGYFVNRLTGSAVVRGLLFGCMVFVLSQLVFAPMTGTGVFSGGDIELLIGGLLGHLVFGGVLGYVYGEGKAPAAQPAFQG